MKEIHPHIVPSTSQTVKATVSDSVHEPDRERDALKCGQDLVMYLLSLDSGCCSFNEILKVRNRLQHHHRVTAIISVKHGINTRPTVGENELYSILWSDVTVRVHRAGARLELRLRRNWAMSAALRAPAARVLLLLSPSHWQSTSAPPAPNPSLTTYHHYIPWRRLASLLGIPQWVTEIPRFTSLDNISTWLFSK